MIYSLVNYGGLKPIQRKDDKDFMVHFYKHIVHRLYLSFVVPQKGTGILFANCLTMRSTDQIYMLDKRGISKI